MNGKVFEMGLKPLLDFLDVSSKTVDDAFPDYDEIVGSVLDKYVTMVTRKTRTKATCPWINDDIRRPRRERRACERHWRKTKLHI